jgi:GDP-L-fucose synthase
MLKASLMQVMDKSQKIFVAGHRGMVGTALVRRLEADGFNNLLTRDRSKLDLADEFAVARFFAAEKPDLIILAAAKVGGIKANNDFPVEARAFIRSSRHNRFPRQRC